ncbi:MAG: hypothetical protein F6K24_43455 [Okeania sp. SIO2D1]|uniref:hypothetical protein n=1 Tax=Okeania sp. SIO2C9 TaxID=2607791 RepID=UPI0013BC636C|nr:hypothetical protein [Okeania sp. SIO2C9]NEQ75458.1 hypothetical protein [Okeania sp. SIO2C9]NES71578.1 hypothetical protein [Okeania sp. SIO2D1]
MSVDPPVHLLPCALGDLFAQANENGYITLADRYGLMAAIFDESLQEYEKRSIDRLIRSICRGRIKVVDEISAVV